MVDFSNFSNTDFNTTPFQYVVFGKGGSLLEVELNEAQYLGFLRDRESLRNLGNRCINGEVKSNGTDITITGDLIIDGYYIHSLNSTIKSVGLPKFLYAKVSIIDYNGNSVVKNNGYIDGNIIPNTIIDSRMGFETTRRRGIQLEFSTIDSDGAIKLLEDDGIGGIRFAIPTMTLSDSVDKAVSELKTNIQSIETNKVTSWSDTPSNTKYPSEKLVKDSLDGKANNNHTHTKSQITDFPTSLPASDVHDWAKASTKPTYTASEVGALASTTTHLSGDIATSEKGSSNGVATLDENGKIPSGQLPSYVDDVLEYSSKDSFPTKGETSKIYVDTTANLTYRWGGSEYVEISPSLALGETSSTAYRGDRGKIAYEHSQTAHAPSNAQQNVQSDWNATSGDAFIKNKPTIPTKVGELTNDKDYATKTEVTKAIDDIEIGGRNLLVGTKDFNIPNSTGNSTVISEKYNGFSVRYYNKAWNFYRPTISLKAGTYTFSTYAKGTEGDNLIMTINNKVKTHNLTSDWERYILVFDVEEDKDVTLHIEANRDVDLYQCGWKLEKGNKATDWTPAPEDTEAEIQSVDNKLTTNMLKPTLGTTTQNGVTCTNNGDGTYTLNGTSSGTSFCVLGDVYLESGKIYRLVGWNNSIVGIQNQLGIYVNEIFRFDIGEGITFTVGTSGFYYINIVYKSGNTFDNFVIKPMITTNLNATYDDFVPYTGDTGQLNSDVAEVRKDFDEHTHKIADVTGLQSALDGKLDKFTSGGIASCGGNGKYSYFKIATIKINDPYINRPVVFEMSGRGRFLSLVTIMFSSENNTDPKLFIFQSNWDAYFWIKKTTTSTWEVYGQYSEPHGNYVLHRITGAGANIGVGVTVNMTNIDSLPSGCTQASYGGNVNYANSAGNADTLDGNHASAFANASHTHNYLPLSGGTLTDELVIDTGNEAKGIYFVNPSDKSKGTRVSYVNGSPFVQGAWDAVVLKENGTLLSNKYAKYEKGTFSPYILSGNINPSSTYAEYKKVGSIVNIAIKMSFSISVYATQLGGILGLPFPVYTGNATTGYYPTFGYTPDGSCSGMIPYDNYMGETPSLSIAELFGQQSAKTFRIYGQYETTA